MSINDQERKTWHQFSSTKQDNRKTRKKFLTLSQNFALNLKITIGNGISWALTGYQFMALFHVIEREDQESSDLRIKSLR